MWKRLLVATASLTLAALALDVLIGIFVIAGDDSLPPYATFSEPTLRAKLEARLEIERKRPPGYVGNYDAELGWVLRPGKHEGRYESGVINSIGARGAREYEPRTDTSPEPGLVRFVCVGDSYTFGTEVADEECWPARMEILDKGFEVINFGVGGYGTDQALLRLRRDGTQLGAQVIVMGVLLENIARNVNRLRTLHYPDTPQPVVKPRFVLRDGQLELLPVPYASRRELYEAALSDALRDTMGENDYWAGDDPWPAWSSIARLVAGRRAERRRNPWLLWQDPQGEPYRVTLALLETFKREALATGAGHALVVLFPTQGTLDVFRGGYPQWYEHLLNDLEERGIEYLDVARALIAAPEGTPLYLHQHFTPEGNDIVARALEGWLSLDPVYR
ncbi:MAG: hypothetical protein GY711_26850 [bacterium]|nr:hypothetical protein [bacterium]